MDNKKIIDGQEYHQIPVDKIYIDGLEFGSTFTTEEFHAAKKSKEAQFNTLPPPTKLSDLSHFSTSNSPTLPDKLSTLQHKSITLNKNLFIASMFFLIATIILLIVLLL